MADKKYSQTEVDNLIRKSLIDYELKVSNQEDEIENLKKQLENKETELNNLRKREKLVSRALILADRRAKYIENTTKTRCAIEIDNLVNFSTKWNKFFDELNNKYNPEDKIELETFDSELKAMINSLTDMRDYSVALSEPEKAYDEERKRISGNKNSLDDRFKRLCNEFDMKVGEKASRKPGRPKKNEGDKKVEEIIYELENGKPIEKQKQNKPLISSIVNKKIAKVTTIPKTEDSLFDFDEALNPTEDLETILSELLGDDFV